MEAFEPASGTVVLFSLADEEAVDERVPMVVEMMPGGGAGGVGNQRVCPHGESADGFGVREALTDNVVQEETGEAAAFGVERGGAAVDVVVRLLAAREGKVAEAEGEGRDEIEEVGAIVSWHGSVRL